MAKIVDRTEEFYKGLEGAKYLHYQDESLPEGVVISSNNVAVNGRGKLVISPFGSSWGWSYGESFHSDFETPEEAIKSFYSFYKK